MQVNNLSLPLPINARLMLCAVCGISTVHHRTESGAWVCWCGHVITAQENTAAVIRKMSDRLAEILEAIQAGQIKPDSDAMRELGELYKALDGSEASHE